MTHNFGGDFRSANFDLLLATAIALGLPLAAEMLLLLSGGAAVSLLLYYGVSCVLIVRWRKGTLDYRWPRRWPWRLFVACLLVPLALIAINWGAFADLQAPLFGFLITLFGWSTLNAAMEQLAWFYVLDAWRNRWKSGPLRLIGLVVGIILLVILVALIHILFWARFLPLAQPTPWSWAAIPLNFVLTGAYAALYYQSRSMWPVFVIHAFADVQLVLLAHYSILPAL